MLNKTLIAYHGTLSKYSNKILEDGFKLPQISTTHDHWLGHGVYFSIIFCMLIIGQKGNVVLSMIQSRQMLYYKLRFVLIPTK